MSNKKVVRKKNTREQRIQEALAKQTTTRFANRYGMTPQEIHKALTGTQASRSNDAIRRKAVTRRDPNRKPRKSLRNPNVVHQPNTFLLEPPNVSISIASEYPTPPWFRSDEKVDVSVIVPLYKSHAVLDDLIKSWNFDHENLSIELILVDDQCPLGSKDSALKFWMARKKELIQKNIRVGRIYQNAANYGFGVTCNTGAYFAKGDYLIFLNADTVVTPGWIRPIVRLLRKEEVGVVGNMQIKHGGIWHNTIDGAGSEWLWDDMCFVHVGRHVYNHFKLAQPFKLDNCPDEILKVQEREMVTGCCLAMRKELFQEVGGFNPHYRVGYWEDSELCMTVREKGYKILYQPASRIYHKLGHSGAGPHRFHDHNRNFFMNKWVNSGRIDSLVQQKRDRRPVLHSILLNRSAAHGDVLAAAAVAGALKKKHKCQILFSTQHPQVLEDHPYIDRVVNKSQLSERNYSVYYDLDMGYEYRPHTNILTSYAELVGVRPEDCEHFIKTAPIDLPDEYIVIHAGKTAWVGRDWDLEKFTQLANRVREKYKVICIGHGGDHKVPCDIDLRNKTSIPQLAETIKRAKFFIGIDSFPMHVAQVVNTPGVAFFGCIKPETRIYRDNMKGVVAPDTPCLGCHHRKLPPCLGTTICDTGTLECISRVSVDYMWNAVEESL